MNIFKIRHTKFNKYKSKEKKKLKKKNNKFFGQRPKQIRKTFKIRGIHQY